MSLSIYNTHTHSLGCMSERGEVLSSERERDRSCGDHLYFFRFYCYHWCSFYLWGSCGVFSFMVSLRKILCVSCLLCFIVVHVILSVKYPKIIMLAWNDKNLTLLASHPTTLLTQANNTSKLWHEIFGHLNFKYLQQLHNDKIVEGFLLIQTSDGVCPGCLVGKYPKKRYEVGKETRAAYTLDLIHSDVLGPMLTTSINGSMYFLTFIDDCSRFCRVYFMKKK